MKLLIRADANNFIATGHIMRCISIAQAAISVGHEVKFVVADFEAKALLEQYEMPYICLETVWKDMDVEIGKMLEVIQVQEPDCVLIDSYYVTKKYMSALRPVCKIAYIDDLNMFVYPCDILICYANYYKKFNYEICYSSDTELLLGTDYAPLRPVFSKKHSSARIEGGRKILVTSGGTDEYHFMSNFLKEYVNNIDKFMGVTVYAVCGAYCNDYDELIKEYADNEHVNILKTVKNIEDYMLEANIAVSAGGSTLYELCVCGTPTICYSFADNQLDNVRSFEQDEVMIYAGDVRYKNITEKIINVLCYLFDNEELLNTYSYRMREKVDGKGAIRIVEAIADNIKYKRMEK